jgi:hypothetical protein
MRRFRIRVVATYRPDRRMKALLANINEWASAAPDREVEGDASIEPFRLTATAWFEIDAADEQAARRAAEERFAA